jgi:ParB-like chromosome segregation protein Spo0J
MGKPKSRVESAAIADMLGVPAAPKTGAAGDMGTPSADRGEGLHPVRDRIESGVARADNALVLDPRRVVRRGHYVRPFTDDRRFRELLTAVEQAGRIIHVPILVRVEGSAGAVEYVLVDGTHRLEAALRLGIQIPAVNLGRITAEQAFAIQVMANEVRATMHVVDQAAYVGALLAQGLTRETVQRTTGFSAGRVSELASMGTALAGLSDADRARARRAPRVTHRALRALKAMAAGDAFRRGLLALVEASEAEAHLASDSYEIDDDAKWLGPSTVGKATSILGSSGYQIPVSRERSAEPRGRNAGESGGVRFVATRNRRGTSVTFRMAWRARGVRADPEVFLERVRDALQMIATEATVDYQAARSAVQGRRGRKSGDSSAMTARSWRDNIAREEAELGEEGADRRVDDRPAPAARGTRGASPTIPEAENPMPVPPSQRHTGEATAGISPRLLAGLSLPMLAERIKRRTTPEYQALDTRLSDVERQAEEARLRAREVLDGPSGRVESRREE